MCEECPNRFMKRSRDIMSKEVFDKVLDYSKEDVPGTMILQKDGEPLLHPNIKGYMLLMDSAIQTKFDIYTNGLLLTAEFVNFLGGLKNKTRILISYHFYNANGSRNDYSRVDGEIISSLNLCHTNVEFVITTHVTDFTNESELLQWKNTWFDVAKKYRMFTAVHVNSHVNPWAGLVKQKNTIHFDGCPYADFGHFFIGVTGNVIPCCMDLEEEIVFGNILEDPKEAIMKKAKDFYKILSSKVFDRDLCKRCQGA